MKPLSRAYRAIVEGIGALMMAAIFCTFILQIVVRYVVGAEWFVATFGDLVDAAKFGWTVEFILVLWLWTIFWGNAFIVRDADHVKFDVLYRVFGNRTRAVLTITGALIITVALWSSLVPSYDKLRILRLKSSATLPVKMLPIYSVYFVFLAVLGMRYLYRAVDVFRHGVEDINPVSSIQSPDVSAHSE